MKRKHNENGTGMEREWNKNEMGIERKRNENRMGEHMATPLMMTLQNNLCP